MLLEFIATVMIFLVGFAILIAVPLKLIYWYQDTKDWQEWYIHGCGYKTTTPPGNVCPKCGNVLNERSVAKRSAEWNRVIMRERFPFIWQKRQ